MYMCHIYMSTCGHVIDDRESLQKLTRPQNIYLTTIGHNAGHKQTTHRVNFHKAVFISVPPSAGGTN